jgi:redox-sensitive bicupin YhaK (pirin superfamily)
VLTLFFSDVKCELNFFSVAFNRDGDQISVDVGESPVRFLLAAAKPIGEPVSSFDYHSFIDIMIRRLQDMDLLL